MSGKSKTDSRSVTAAERRLSALQMRKEGRTYREIGKGLGITGTAAYGLVRRAVDSMLKKSFEEAEMIVALENERLDGYLFALNDKIQKGSTQAIGQALKIMERRARLLGLDKPSKIAPTDPEGNEPYEPISDAERTERIMAILDRARARRDMEESIRDAQEGIEASEGLVSLGKNR